MPVQVKPLKSIITPKLNFAQLSQTPTDSSSWAILCEHFMIACCISDFSRFSSMICFCMWSFSRYCLTMDVCSSSKLAITYGLITLTFSSFCVLKWFSIRPTSCLSISISFLYSRRATWAASIQSSTFLQWPLTDSSTGVAIFAPFYLRVWFALGEILLIDAEALLVLAFINMLSERKIN